MVEATAAAVEEKGFLTEPDIRLVSGLSEEEIKKMAFKTGGQFRPTAIFYQARDVTVDLSSPGQIICILDRVNPEVSESSFVIEGAAMILRKNSVTFVGGPEETGYIHHPVGITTMTLSANKFVYRRILILSEESNWLEEDIRRASQIVKQAKNSKFPSLLSLRE